MINVRERGSEPCPTALPIVGSFSGNFAATFTPPGPSCPAGGGFPLRWPISLTTKAVIGRAGHPQGPQRVDGFLEVGPGTGAVTRQIIRRMKPADRLDLVEINESFVARLNQQFREDEEFRAVGPRAAVHCARVEDLHAEMPYDVIVSGLPLNNFAVAEVKTVLTALRRLAAEGATLTFFQYMGIRRVKAVISGRGERARLRGIGQVLDDVLQSHEIRRDWIWSNVPPAWVHHLQF